MLHDPKTGELALQGWEINGEKWINDNSHEVSRALFTPMLSVLKNRELNIFFLTTADHYIEVMPNIRYGTIDAINKVSVIGINPKNESSYMEYTT